MNNPMQKKIDGPTPNGGAYAIVYFRDSNGNRCNESECYDCEIVEYDNDGRFIFSTLSEPKSSSGHGSAPEISMPKI